LAYTLAKIDIRELKTSVSSGSHTYNLVGGLIPITVGALSQISDSTTPGSNQWSYFPSENELRLNTTGVLSSLYVNYTLLVSNKNGAFYPLNPTGGGTSYNWPPYMQNSPAVIGSATNILEGLVSYNSLSIILQSGTANNIRNFFGSNFSVMLQGFKLWRISNTGAIASIYTGIGSGVSFKSDSITYQCRPKIKRLDEPATFGLPQYTNASTTPIHVASVVPFSFGYKNRSDYEGYSTPDFDTFAAENLIKLDYTHDGSSNTLQLFSGITMDDFSFSNYVNYGGSFGSYASSVFEYENNTEGCIGSPPSAPVSPSLIDNVTGILRPCSLKLNDYTGATIGDRPQQFRVDTGSSVYYMVPGWRASITSAGPIFNIWYMGYSSAASGVTDNNPSVSVENEFYLLMRIKKNTDARTNTNLNSNHLVILKTLYGTTMIPSTNAGSSAYTYRFNVNLSNSDNVYYYLGDSAADKARLENQEIEFYMYYNKTPSHASLSMKKFMESCLVGAGFDYDISEVDFDESMQLIEHDTPNYRNLMQRLFAGNGCFLRYDHENDLAKVIKINSSKATVATINENEFSGLSTALNTEDTYNQVIFKNKSMFIGANTRGTPSGSYEYNKTVENPQDLNQTDKTKTIDMLTLENSRASEIAQFHFDNKYKYSFSCPATDKFLDIQIGDWISLVSDQVPETSGTAKVLITKKAIGETSIGFDGIKFATIN